jgi:uncharacterized membrane protein YcgQ (UPF0703/DUF1980 family)
MGILGRYWKMKHILSIILSFLFTFGLIATSTSALVKAPNITINGKEITFSQTTGIPYYNKSLVYVPISTVAHVMGYKTSIKGATAVVTLPNKNITFKIGDINNTVKTKDGKVMAPISKVAPLLGYQVETTSSNSINIKKHVVQTASKLTVQKPANINASSKTQLENPVKPDNKNAVRGYGINTDGTVTFYDEYFGYLHYDVESNPRKYNNLKVVIVGFVHRDTNFKENEFKVARLQPSRCAAPPYVLGLMCRTENATDFNTDEWVMVKGKIVVTSYIDPISKFEYENVYIEPESIEKVPRPDNFVVSN